MKSDSLEQMQVNVTASSPRDHATSINESDPSERGSIAEQEIPTIENNRLSNS